MFLHPIHITDAAQHRLTGLYRLAWVMRLGQRRS